MKIEETIPYGISDYIREHFKEDFLFRIKDVKKINDHSTYVVEVSKDDYIYTLRFNEDGVLLKEDVEQAFPPDMHEEQTFRDVPE
jgi:hypothetical protein